MSLSVANLKILLFQLNLLGQLDLSRSGKMLVFSWFHKSVPWKSPYGPFKKHPKSINFKMLLFKCFPTKAKDLKQKCLCYKEHNADVPQYSSASDINWQIILYHSLVSPILHSVLHFCFLHPIQIPVSIVSQASRLCCSACPALLKRFAMLLSVISE